MILITGCAGFIGSHLSLSYLRDGIEVYGIDNFDPFYDLTIKKYNLKQLSHFKGFHFQSLDITDKEKVSKFFQNKKFSVVFHLAARPGVAASLVDPLPYERINIYGTLLILEQMRKLRDIPLVFTSSSSVYGAIKEMPFREDMCLESQLSPYGTSKWAAETYCRLYHDLYGISVTILRLFTVYGVNVRPDMAIYKFIKRIRDGKKIVLYDRGEVERDYTYIDDVISGLRLAATKNFPFEIINLGNGSPVKIKYLVNLLERKLIKKAKIESKPLAFGEMKKTYASIEKAKKLLSWEPVTSIEEGVDKLLDWFKKYQNKKKEKNE